MPLGKRFGCYRDRLSRLRLLFCRAARRRSKAKGGVRVNAARPGETVAILPSRGASEGVPYAFAGS